MSYDNRGRREVRSLACAVLYHVQNKSLENTMTYITNKSTISPISVHLLGL